MAHPVTVVQDAGDCLAVLLEPGSPFSFPTHPFGEHPWAVHQAWSGTRVLQLHRDGDAYGVWRFFDLDGLFMHWYINFEAPIVRHVDGAGGGGFDTNDYGVDIVIPADGSPWCWKDVDDPSAMVASGRISRSEEGQIMAEAQTVAEQLDAGLRWWSMWDGWTPGDAPPAIG
jgi:predicted RNA-binding protein associated with RNAse of E/G family